MHQSAGILFIVLDSKSRLVLPLKIRNYLGITKNGRVKLSILSAEKSSVAIALSNPVDETDVKTLRYSKNISYADER